MYTAVIKHTYLNKSRLIMKDEYGNPLPFEAEVSQYASINGNLTDLLGTYPEYDYEIEGFLRIMPYGKHEFIIASPGNCTMYITGIPRDTPSLAPFRIFGDKNTRYSSYWEDDNRGYLFQIISKQIQTQNAL